MSYYWLIAAHTNYNNINTLTNPSPCSSHNCTYHPELSRSTAERQMSNDNTDNNLLDSAV